MAPESPTAAAAQLADASSPAAASPPGASLGPASPVSSPAALPQLAGSRPALFESQLDEVAEESVAEGADAAEQALAPAALAAKAEEMGSKVDEEKEEEQHQEECQLAPALAAHVAAAVDEPELGLALPVEAVGELELEAQAVPADVAVAVTEAEVVPGAEQSMEELGGEDAELDPAASLVSDAMHPGLSAHLLSMSLSTGAPASTAL
jgi:hypothetical protein